MPRNWKSVERPGVAAWLAAGLIAFLAGPAVAAEAVEGRDLARRWCVSCHQVEPNSGTSDVAPAFEMIANDPKRTEGRLRAWLIDPHPPMPNLSLTRHEIDAILAYLATLRHQ